MEYLLSEKEFNDLKANKEIVEKEIVRQCEERLDKWYRKIQEQLIPLFPERRNKYMENQILDFMETVKDVIWKTKI